MDANQCKLYTIDKNRNRNSLIEENENEPMILNTISTSAKKLGIGGADSVIRNPKKDTNAINGTRRISPRMTASIREE